MFSKGLVLAISTFLCLIRANENQSKILIDELYQDKLWVLEKSTDDSLKIYSKKINGINLMAFRVNKTVTIDPLEIINVVSDLENYANFISNSKNLKTEKLDQNDGSLRAYQHIKISLPFFSDRDYFFKMIANKEALYNDKLIEWSLIELERINEIDMSIKDENAIYLDYGAGMWLSRPVGDEKFDISYRLIMDPGGYIPDLLVEMINEVALISLFKDVLKEARSRRLNY